MSDVNQDTPIAAEYPPDKGFKGRKIVAGLITAGSFFASGVYGWLWATPPRMTAMEFIDLGQWVILPTVAVALGLITAEKIFKKDPK